MTQEDKYLLLLKDLCTRIPYGVRCSFGVDDAVYEICGINPSCCGASAIQATHIKSSINGDFKLASCKPYLFPLSSMTEEQKLYLEWHTKYRLDDGELVVKKDEDDEYLNTNIYDYLSLIDWLNKNHFDYIGLIEKGLAVDATNLGIYENKTITKD